MDDRSDEVHPDVVESDPFREFVLSSYAYWRDAYERSDSTMTLNEFLSIHWQNAPTQMGSQ